MAAAKAKAKAARAKGGGRKKNRKKKKKKSSGERPGHDKHYLYTASVQSVEADIDFFRRIYRRKRGRPFRRLREDFCGTAALACEWARRSRRNEAWGVDLDGPTLQWARQRYLPAIGPAAERVHLLQQDVTEVCRPAVDLVAALNFSFFVFKTRETLGGYFRQVHRSLADDGIFVLDLFGGTESMLKEHDTRKVPASKALDGTKVPRFTYGWEQAHFNPIDHHMICHINFRLRGKRKLRRAFTYDWRMWMVPEVRELLAEAGFVASEVYVEGWDEEEQDTDGIFRRRAAFDNEGSWIAYVVALR